MPIPCLQQGYGLIVVCLSRQQGFAFGLEEFGGPFEVCRSLVELPSLETRLSPGKGPLGVRLAAAQGSILPRDSMTRWRSSIGRRLKFIAICR